MFLFFCQLKLEKMQNDSGRPAVGWGPLGGAGVMQKGAMCVTLHPWELG